MLQALHARALANKSTTNPQKDDVAILVANLACQKKAVRGAMIHTCTPCSVMVP